jgi:heterodisulfide reductase subunit C
MKYIDNLVFVIILGFAVWFFSRNMRKIARNIKLGKPHNRNDRSAQRWKVMARLALGQGKMGVKPVAGMLHGFVYVGFILINIEVMEILIDGIFGTHRVLSFLGGSYVAMISFFEVLALLVLISCAIFLIRRNILRIKRFMKKEMEGWPWKDANYILIMEIVLMVALLTMNGADVALQQLGNEHYVETGSFFISGWLTEPWLSGLNESTLIFIERACWWFHIIGILFFLNYLYYSKHLHILLAFPNTYYSKLEPMGEFNNLEAVTNEVKLMMDPNADPYAVPADGAAEPETFGAKDIFDLNQAQLLNAYSCTECGRCTEQCPANMTGKLLSPRRIMMATRDRLEDVGKIIDQKGKWEDDGKTLHNYISAEELWACTTCNACVQACPVGIDPMSIIVDMRRYLVMEQSQAPQELNVMMSNIENNGAPWPYALQDRLKWTEE